MELFSTWYCLEESLFTHMSNDRQTARMLFMSFLQGADPKRITHFGKHLIWISPFCVLFSNEDFWGFFVPFRLCLNVAFMQRAKTLTDQKWLNKD